MSSSVCHSHSAEQLTQYNLPKFKRSQASAHLVKLLDTNLSPRRSFWHPNSQFILVKVVEGETWTLPAPRYPPFFLLTVNCAFATLAFQADCVLAKVGIICGVGDLLFPRVAVLCSGADSSSFVKFGPRPKWICYWPPAAACSSTHFAQWRFHLLCICWSGAWEEVVPHSS